MRRNSSASDDDRSIAEQAALEAAFALLVRVLKDAGGVERLDIETKLRELGSGLVNRGRSPLSREIGLEVGRLAERFA